MEPLKFSNPISIIHFNDVYDIEPDNDQGGVARFYTALEKYRDENTIVLFSGDVFRPSFLSTLYCGEQMIFPLNKFNITASCFGNHDFDFETEDVIKLKNQTNFPWIMSNVFLSSNKKPLGEGIEFLIIEKNGLKIGLIGLAEPEWLGLLLHLEQSDTIYMDFIEVSKKYCKLFKEAKCDLIIALTHMRTHNDEKLAQEVPDIDLILGGHDHIIYQKKIENSLILKSGANFHDFHVINLDFSKKICKPTYEFPKYYVSLHAVHVDESFQENKELKEYVQQYLEETEKIMEKTEAFTEVPLDTRFSLVRTQETAICNFFADVMRAKYLADICIMNNGFMRSDCIFEAGRLTKKMVSKMIPSSDYICVLEASGKVILEALENGVSKYPSFDGRFPGVSGISFIFNPNLPENSRVLRDSVRLEKGEFKEDNLYKLAVKGFIADGKDGYEVLKSCKRIVDEENASLLSSITAEFFNLPNKSLLNETKNKEVKAEAYVERWKKLIYAIKKEENQSYVVINPKVEGRVKMIIE